MFAEVSVFYLWPSQAELEIFIGWDWFRWMGAPAWDQYSWCGDTSRIWDGGIRGRCASC